MTVSKLGNQYDVRDWDSTYGDGGDDGAIITACAAWVKSQGGGRILLPFGGLLASPALVPSGVYLDGAGREKTTFVQDTANSVGIHFAGNGLGDFRRSGGANGFAVELTDSVQTGVFAEGCRQLELYDFAVSGTGAGGTGVQISSRTNDGTTGVNDNQYASAFNNLWDFTCRELAIGIHLIRGPIFNNRNFIRWGHMQACVDGVVIDNSATNIIIISTQGITGDAVRLENDASVNEVALVQEGGDPVHIHIADATCINNTFRGVTQMSKVTDNGTTNEFYSHQLNVLQETHLDREYSRQRMADAWVNASTSSQLDATAGSVALLTLDANAIFTMDTGRMANIEGYSLVDPVFEYRLILRNSGGFTPDFTALNPEWASPGGVQPSPWPANTTVLDMYSHDGGASWIVAPKAGF